MTFPDRESSQDEGTPVRLFKFIYGPLPGAVFTFSDGEDTIQYDDGLGGGVEDYVPPNPLQAALNGSSLTLGAVRSSGDIDRSEVQCRMADGTGLDDLFLIYPPAVPVTMIVRYGHVGDTDFRLAFTGVVLSATREFNELVLATEPITSALRRPGLRRFFQVSCPRVVYRGGCPANKALATTSQIVQAIPSSNIITLSTGWNNGTARGNQPVEKFRGGTVEWPNAVGAIEKRGILRPTANQITISGPVRDLAVNDPVDVVLGCNRLMDDCELLHMVIRSYGGWPFVPNDNPFELANQFY